MLTQRQPKCNVMLLSFEFLHLISKMNGNHFVPSFLLPLIWLYNMLQVIVPLPQLHHYIYIHLWIQYHKIERKLYAYMLCLSLIRSKVVAASAIKLFWISSTNFILKFELKQDLLSVWYRMKFQVGEGSSVISNTMGKSYQTPINPI